MRHRLRNTITMENKTTILEDLMEDLAMRFTEGISIDAKFQIDFINAWSAEQVKKGNLNKVRKIFNP